MRNLFFEIAQWNINIIIMDVWSELTGTTSNFIGSKVSSSEPKEMEGITSRLSGPNSDIYDLHNTYTIQCYLMIISIITLSRNLLYVVLIFAFSAVCTSPSTSILLTCLNSIM